MQRRVARPNFRVLKKEVETKTVVHEAPFRCVLEQIDHSGKPSFRSVGSNWLNVCTSSYEIKFIPKALETPRNGTLADVYDFLDGLSKIRPTSAHGSEVLDVLRHEIVQTIEKTIAEALASWRQKLTSTERAASSSTAAPSDPLAAARARGVTYMKAQLELPENINLDTAAQYSGLSGRHINELRQRGEFYALVLEGNTRGFRYPQWQFDAEFERLAPLMRALKQKSLSCWAIHDFLTRSNDDLGKSPKNAILDPNFPLRRIEQAIEKRFGNADQGAV